ncbi:MAG: chromosomal replication initiator protein DnaA [Tissierellia bacterium]|nr:chromosomal replication initiator protein DnaA [Tissierellia bacterium]
MNEELMSIWEEVKDLLRHEMSEVQFNTWISQLQPISYTEDTFYLYAPNSFIVRLIEMKHGSTITKHMAFLFNKTMNVIILDPSTLRDVPEPELIPDPSAAEAKPFQPDRGSAGVEKRPKGDIQELNNLVSRYSFENFVKGKSNEFALAASMAVANSPGDVYNPLFIYGGAGLGKTHLMNACAQSIVHNYPNKQVVYLSSETFTNELIQSLNSRKNLEFRRKYRDVDVLLIDDIQFIAGKVGTQEEFFHTFNDLYNNNKQIIISSDRHPKEIKTLEDRLVSRFEWGLIADIQQPDFETRVAILRKKTEYEKETVPMEVLKYIAMNIKNNIRELEGALLKVIAYSSLMKVEKIDLDCAKEALSKLINEKEEKVITIDLIKDMVAEFYDIRTEDLLSKNRSRQVAFPRQVAMYLSRQMTDLSLLKIANSFNRDHSTVIHGVDKIEQQLKEDSALEEEIKRLLEKIRS